MSIFTNLLTFLDQYKTNDVKEVQKEVKKLQKDNNSNLLPIPQNFQFSKKSKDCLSSCHPDIQRVLNEAIKYYDFAVIEGTRSKKIQDEYFAKGTSKVKYPNSYHNTLATHIKDDRRPKGLPDNKVCSLAVDVVPTPIDWNDLKRFAELARIIKICAGGLDIPIEWGPNLWNGWDYPHWQLTSYRKNK